MTRLLAFTVAALATGLTPVLAADTSSPSTPPTANTVSPDASKEATVPPSGSADTSGGATEQSSSPPSASSTGKMGEQGSSAPSAESPSGKMSETPDQTNPNPTVPSSGNATPTREYYVQQEVATQECNLGQKKPDGTKEVMIGNAYATKEEAVAARKAAPECQGHFDKPEGQ